MPTFFAGTRLTAATLQAAVGLKAVKGADTGPRVNNTLAADPDLVLTLAANSTYDFGAELLYKGAASGTGDLKLGWTGPSGFAMEFGMQGVDSGLVARFWYYTQASNPTPATNGTSNPLSTFLSGTITTAGTAGTLTLLWAENVTNATGTTLMTGSKLWAALK